ncbi:MAG TPA: SLC13 family permease [Burkholderiales bacterium]|nr:SLC13 family permease [Burkholderiales bacterium]
MIDVLAIPGLDGHGVAVISLAALAFVLLAWDRWPIQSISLGILGALATLFLFFPYQHHGRAVEPFEFFYGFGHQALIAICALMILGRALVATGALDPVARRLAHRLESRPRVALLTVLVGAALASGFVNDTPIVVVLIPLLMSAADKSGGSPAQMLMPMNFAVLIGGMATTIGTSTNLIVVSMVAGHGLGQIGMFDFYPIVAIAAIPALAYLWLVAPLLLRKVESPTPSQSQLIFTAELRVTEGSPLDGLPVGEVRERTNGKLSILEIRRGDHLTLKHSPSATLQAGDRIVVRDTAENLKEFGRMLGAELHGPGSERGAAERRASEGRAEAGREAEPGSDEQFLAQLIITEDSTLEGTSLRRSRFPEVFGLSVVGLRRSAATGQWRREDISDTILRSGDVLLVQGTDEQIREAQSARAGLVLDSRVSLPRSNKAPLVLGILAAVVLLAAFKVMPIALAALAGVLLLIGSGCLKWDDAKSALSSKVILLIASSLALGKALTVTGGTSFLAHHLVQTAAQLDTAWFLALLMLLMGVLTNFVSNTAAAAIGTPLAWETALQLGAHWEPFVLAVLFGCNLCYLTPMGYQTNLLVMNAAGYRFSDFSKVGGFLFVLMWGVLTWLLVHVYDL